MHEAQLPAEHTLSVPQAVPSDIDVPTSMQPTAGEQTVFPPWQALVGVQSAPLLHAAQTPPLHTIPGPHDVPFGALPDSRQTGSPVLHAVAPTRQTLDGTEQVAPTTHATQAPVAPQT